MKYIDKNGNICDSYVEAGMHNIKKVSHDTMLMAKHKIKKSIVINMAKSSVKSVVNKITRRIPK